LSAKSSETTIHNGESVRITLQKALTSFRCFSEVIKEGVRSMNVDVAVVGGGPAGASAANELAKKGLSTVLVERNLSNAKPCGGAIPLGLIEEFEIPDYLVERKVTEMAVRSPKGKVVTMSMPHGFVGMVRRERFDKFLVNVPHNTVQRSSKESFEQLNKQATATCFRLMSKTVAQWKYTPTM
jgi:hypothetical protein